MGLQLPPLLRVIHFPQKPERPFQMYLGSCSWLMSCHSSRLTWNRSWSFSSALAVHDVAHSLCLLLALLHHMGFCELLHTHQHPSALGPFLWPVALSLQVLSGLPPSLAPGLCSRITTLNEAFLDHPQPALSGPLTLLLSLLCS